MYKTPLPFIGGGLVSAAFNKSKKETKIVTFIPKFESFILKKWF